MNIQAARTNRNFSRNNSYPRSTITTSWGNDINQNDEDIPFDCSGSSSSSSPSKNLKNKERLRSEYPVQMLAKPPSPLQQTSRNFRQRRLMLAQQRKERQQRQREEIHFARRTDSAASTTKYPVPSGKSLDSDDSKGKTVDEVNVEATKTNVVKEVVTHNLNELEIEVTLEGNSNKKDESFDTSYDEEASYNNKDPSVQSYASSEESSVSSLGSEPGLIEESDAFSASSWLPPKLGSPPIKKKTSSKNQKGLSRVKDVRSPLRASKSSVASGRVKGKKSTSAIQVDRVPPLYVASKSQVSGGKQAESSSNVGKKQALKPSNVNIENSEMKAQPQHEGKENNSSQGLKNNKLSEKKRDDVVESRLTNSISKSKDVRTKTEISNSTPIKISQESNNELLDTPSQPPSLKINEDSNVANTDGSSVKSSNSFSSRKMEIKRRRRQQLEQYRLASKSGSFEGERSPLRKSAIKTEAKVSGQSKQEEREEFNDDEPGIISTKAKNALSPPKQVSRPNSFTNGPTASQHSKPPRVRSLTPTPGFTKGDIKASLPTGDRLQTTSSTSKGTSSPPPMETVISTTEDKGQFRSTSPMTTTSSFLDSDAPNNDIVSSALRSMSPHIKSTRKLASPKKMLSNETPKIPDCSSDAQSVRSTSSYTVRTYGTSGNSTTNERLEERLRSDQQKKRKLFLLHHALTCSHPPPPARNADDDGNNDDKSQDSYVACKEVRHCQALSTLIKHVQSCTYTETTGNECEVPGCAGYKSAWNHYRRCVLNRFVHKGRNCRFCSDLWLKDATEEEIESVVDDQ